MLFATVDFMIFFVVVLTAITIVKYRNFQFLFLLGASYFFFYFSSNYLIVLLISSTILDFFVAKAIFNTQNASKRKILLIITLVGNIGLLGFFKYSDFMIFEFNMLGQMFNLESNIPYLNLALPIGISFYTFQTIGYTVDVYRRKLEPCKSFLEFALFVSFFPQLVAGPIIRASNFLPQLREKISEVGKNSRLRLFSVESRNLKAGITLIAFGFLKKMFFADNIAPLVDDIFANPIGAESFTIILGAIAFGIQIYGDFSGYSDIAIGAALVLGLKIPINFNKPYFASSPSDFWRRWHISLSSWLRDYLYIPLGGKRKSDQRTYVNLITVMFFGGLWHGASVNFIIWGVLHGTYLIIHKIILDKVPSLKNNSFFKTKLGRLIAIFVTQYFIFLTWISFRVSEVDHMIYSMQKYVILDFQITQTLEVIYSHKISIFLLVLFIFLHYVTYKKEGIKEKISNLSYPYWILFLVSVILGILLLYDGNPEDFIYFKF
ncbi:MAG: MBOAT family protein [Candidatus Nitrosopelagicus sp.]|nr:MBOAT family protein [Candidatus Nitrosopelagicus sp.]